jgi:hypothetical protein
MASEGFSKRMLKMRGDFVQFLFSEYSTLIILLTVKTQGRGERQILPPERPRDLQEALKLSYSIFERRCLVEVVGLES